MKEQRKTWQESQLLAGERCNGKTLKSHKDTRTSTPNDINRTDYNDDGDDIHDNEQY